jgi:tRNA nucleotidyltransferase (CCA-adding enzyme)
MHVLQTHEQADFDALGSLLGAYLLQDTAMPVLPHRMNRNVRAFLSLYGAELPFLEQRDLPNETIERLTLVDTQSMISLKGMSREASVDVIDHHPQRENLPVNWSVITEDIGATTTLMVEGLREINGRLNTIQATLMLLGIYEDTGSLTYKRTSARDLQAAAFLLEQGASLEIASSFLNHPLSPAQEALYERLRLNAEHVHIHGYTIVISYGEALEMEEELSTLAHKLRDLLDPDALFLLVTTRSGVQIIARSTTDNIDVAAVTAEFGGGGHERAAAGLIRDCELEEVRAELKRVLPVYVRPSVTVAEIMSSRPQLLAPDTPVEEAAVRMSRFGYEGYPVVERGKVVGLLTRRAVDRAIAHQLSTTADKLMEAGSYTVQPDDSIEHLQRLVAESGWGQIPVVDSENGRIIGIVTRTDLLKTLTSKASLPGRLNLAERLEAVLPPGRLSLLKAIAGEAHEQHAALYIVGGFVRDLLLEIPSLDFDLVVEGEAIALGRALARRYGGRVTSHSRFGTAKWHLAGASLDKPVAFNGESGLQSVDLVSARTEFYTHPTALPTVERGSIKLDLHRRDFTMNTLALRLDGRHYGDLHDYWGGLNDLHQKLVRVLHSLSFVDDPTRILRAVRFEQRFSFHIEERTLELLMEARSLIDRLSGDRIRHELNAILDSNALVKIMERLNELGLLSAIHPDLVWDGWLQERMNELTAEEASIDWGIHREERPKNKTDLAYILWLIRLPSERARKVAKRLKFPAILMEAVLNACWLWETRQYLETAKPSQVVGHLEKTPDASWYALYLACEDETIRRSIQSYASQWRKVTPTIDGNGLKERGLPPGPEYRRILSDLRAAWLDGLIRSQQEEEAFLSELLTRDDR